MLTVDEQMQDTFRGFQRALLLGENDCCILTVDVKNLNNHTFIDEKLKWIHFHLFAAVVPLSRSTTMHLKRHAQKLLFIGASGHRLIAKSERRSFAAGEDGVDPELHRHGGHPRHSDLVDLASGGARHDPSLRLNNGR